MQLIGVHTGRSEFIDKGGIPPLTRARTTFTPSLRKKTHANRKTCGKEKKWQPIKV